MTTTAMTPRKLTPVKVKARADEEATLSALAEKLEG